MLRKLIVLFFSIGLKFDVIYDNLHLDIHDI